MWQMGERLTCPPPSTHPSPLVTIVPIHLTPAACEQPCGRGANFSPRDVNAVLWARRRGVPSFPHPFNPGRQVDVALSHRNCQEEGNQSPPGAARLSLLKAFVSERSRLPSSSDLAAAGGCGHIPWRQCLNNVTEGTATLLVGETSRDVFCSCYRDRGHKKYYGVESAGYFVFH